MSNFSTERSQRIPGTSSSERNSLSYQIVTSDPIRGETLSTNLRSVFPCSDPAARHMSSEEARFQTFTSQRESWPGSRIAATPREMAKAGLYYIGERDRVKCWYCNGGLQNWERYDNPWKEHAKWYPTCEFILQQKGPDFVHRIVADFPDLRRPVLNVRESSNRPQLRQVESRPHYLERSISSNQSIQIIDPREEARRIEERIEREMQASEVSDARQMGFASNEIRTAIRRRLNTENESFPSLETLLDAILNLSPEEVAQRGELNNQYQTETPSVSLEATENVSLAEGNRELQRLEESRRCKVCRNAQVSMVFIPCGHLSTCLACGQNLETCPICQSHICEKVRSYMV